MKTKRFLILTALTVAVALASPVRLTAQTNPQSQSPQTKQATPSKPETNDPTIFRFDGGTVDIFVKRIKEHFGIDLRQHGTIGDEMWSVVVPKFRMQSADLSQVLNLYNQLSSEGKKSLGHWIVKEGNVGGVPTAVVLVSPSETDVQSESKIVIRAFSLRGIGEKERELLVQTVSLEQDRLWERVREGQLRPDQLDGRINYHPSSEILMASGGKTFVDLVQTLVEAFRERAGTTGQTVSEKTKPSP